MKLGQPNTTQVAALAQRVAARAAEDKDAKDQLDESAGTRKVTAESFIASVSAARRPPPIALNDIAPTLAGSGATEIFKAELDGFARKSSDDISAAFAGVFLGYAEKARAEGNPALDDAFDLLGETMVNYEHLRLLRTGQLG